MHNITIYKSSFRAGAWRSLQRNKPSDATQPLSTPGGKKRESRVVKHHAVSNIYSTRATQVLISM